MASATTRGSAKFARGVNGWNPMRHFPRLRQSLWRWTYYGYSRVSTAEFTFMNLGYAVEADENAAPSRLADYYSRRLYDRVVRDVQLRDTDLLEVGCGRGGGSAYMQTQFSPRSVVGVDLVASSIERCRARHVVPGLTFQPGDAMALPFDAECFDTVVNVESSHCYPSRARFFAEVSRVLRPSGHFLFADLMFPFYDGLRHDDVARMLLENGFTVVASENITSNVLRSRQLLSSGSNDWLTRAVPILRFMPTRFRRESAHLEGSTVYNALSDGSASYWCWSLRKL